MDKKIRISDVPFMCSVSENIQTQFKSYGKETLFMNLLDPRNVSKNEIKFFFDLYFNKFKKELSKLLFEYSSSFLMEIIKRELRNWFNQYLRFDNEKTEIFISVYYIENNTDESTIEIDVVITIDGHRPDGFTNTDENSRFIMD